MSVLLREADRKSLVFIGLLIALATADAWWLRWLADDAFVSMAYARNLVDGYGLTLDPVTPTEGYTNFLWTVMLAGWIAADANFFYGAAAMGLAAFALLAALTAWWSFHLYRGSRRSLLSAVLPTAYFTAVYHNREFATSGLETMAFALFANAAAFAAWRALDTDRRSWFGLAGLLAALTALMRADGVVWAACVAAAVSVESLRKGRGAENTAANIARFVAPALAVLTPYWIWKWSYYHAFLPNTALAKMALTGYVGQGLIYAGFFFGFNGVPVLVPFFRLRDLRHSFLWTLAAAWTAYVIYVGGDYMFGRFFVPVVPVIGLLAVETIDRTRFRRTLAATFIGVTLASPLAFSRMTTDADRPSHVEGEVLIHPTDHMIGPSFIHGITDERSHYRRSVTKETMKIYRDQVERWRPVWEHFDGYLFFDQFRSFFFKGYPKGFDAFGLTSAAIAEKPVSQRGRIGHEKYNAMDWRELIRRYHPILNDRGGDRDMASSRLMVEFPPDRYAFMLVAWDAELVASLRAAGAEIPDPGLFSDRLCNMPDEEIGGKEIQSAEFLLERYFPFVDDPDRVRRLTNWLALHR